jgi:aminoglycoside 6'-N-acetyltransferase
MAMTIAFRPVTRPDFGLVAGWITAPHVRPWWPDDPSPEGLETTYGPVVDGTDPTEVFIVVRHDVPIGLIQRYRLDDNPGWRAALALAGTPDDSVGIDYLIGQEALTGEGLGPAIIARFVSETWERHPDVDAVVVSVQQGNRRSWRALEKSGFQREWTGVIESDDPSDAGTSYVYACRRPITPP